MTNFDLISDLHIDRWPEANKIIWKGLGTSLTCVVAGDISQNPRITRDILYELSDSYNQVIFVDGNHEHKGYYDKIKENSEWYDNICSKRKNLTYLYDSTCIVGKTAFIGTNGWWSFDHLEPNISRLEHIDHFCHKENIPHHVAIEIWDNAAENAEFLAKIVSHLTETNRIEEIIVVTHTCPRKELIQIPATWDLTDAAKMTNSMMADVLTADTSGKITTWCFGHCHDFACDVELDGIRYVSNPRGRPDDALSPVYYPKLIKTTHLNLG